MPRWRARGGALALLLGGAFGLHTSSALACSCAADTDAREQLQHAAGAVIGTVTATRSTEGAFPDIVLTVHVDRSFAGATGPDLEIHTRESAGLCGLGERPVGSHLSQFLHRGPSGEWTTSICDRVEGGELRRAAQPLPPVRRGRAALVVGGAFGRLRSIALDRLGRPVGYGRADGTVVAAAVCPGGRFEVEAVLPERPGDHGRLAVRRLPDLRLVRDARLPGSAYPTDLTCADPRARKVLMFQDVSRGRTSLGRVLAWNGRAFRTRRAVASRRGVLAGDRVYAIKGRGRQSIVSAALDGGRITRIARLPGEVTRIAADATGRVAAFVFIPVPGSAPHARLVAFDPHARGARLRAVTVSSVDAVDLLWTRRGQLVLVTSENRLRVYDASLQRLRTVTLAARGVGDVVGPLTLHGDTLYGVADGRLVSVGVSHGRLHAGRRLPVGDIAVLTGAPGGPRAARAVVARAAACASWTRVGAVSL